MAEREYLILDMREVVGNCALFWRPEGRGYTCNLDEAGLYTYEEAMSHRDTDIPVHIDTARGSAVTHVRRDWLRQHMPLTKENEK